MFYARGGPLAFQCPNRKPRSSRPKRNGWRGRTFCSRVTRFGPQGRARDSTRLVSLTSNIRLPFSTRCELALSHPPSRQRRLNVLFLAKLFPWPLNFGARQRVFHLARGIAARHNVSVIAFDALPSPAEESEFLARSGCARVQVVSRDQGTTGERKNSGLLSRIRGKIRSVDARLRSPLPVFVREIWSEQLVATLESAKREDSVDVVFATQSWMAEHASVAGFDKIIVDVDDLLSHMSRQRAAASGWHRRKPIELFDAAKDLRYEHSLPKRFSRVIVAKNEDRDFFAAADRPRVSVIANGITVPSVPSPEPVVADTLLFVGTLGYGPNIDAVRWFATDVLPLIWAKNPEVRFTVAGFGSAGSLAEVLRDPRCAIHESPTDLSPLYGEAAVVVAPVRIGGGTRIKILEALARGRAVVSTTFAAEGLGLRGGVELEYADTPAEMATRCVELLLDQRRRRALAAAGRATIAAIFGWSSIETTLPALVSRVVNSADTR
jgi:polysaccharide biosynthesis protein PslH